jgi:hypothetical protein
MVAEPETIAFETRRRVDQLDAFALDARLQPRDVLGVTAERQMMQRLGFAFDDGTPAVVMTESLELQRIAVAHHVQPEIRIEIVGDIDVGNRQHELIERMHAKRAGFRCRRDVALNSRHPETP